MMAGVGNIWDAWGSQKRKQGSGRKIIKKGTIWKTQAKMDRILKKWYDSLWTGFVGSGQGEMAGAFECENKPLGSKKKWICCLAVEISAFTE